MKTTNLSPNLMETAALKLKNTQQKLTTWWQQHAQTHWQKWGVWVWLLVMVFVWGQLIHDDFIKGFTAGRNSSEKMGYWESYFTLYLALPFVIGLIIFFGVLFGSFHYQFIYKPILRTYKASNIILYIVVCLTVYEHFLGDYLFEKLFKNPKDANEDDMWASVIWALSLMYSIITDFRKHEQAKQQLERERNLAEIQALKAQINPHFLFNTLNNLYGTALVEDSPKTAEGIQQLAGIMRHAVESSKNERIEIEKEINFLRDYVEIQQIRLPKRDNIRVEIDIRWDEQPAQIAPLLLMTFAENAFKYGVNVAQDCFLELKLKVENGELTFVCRNSIVPRTQIEKGTGTGVENTLRRLRLLYPHRHTVNINQTEHLYEVFLTINLHD